MSDLIEREAEEEADDVISNLTEGQLSRAAQVWCEVIQSGAVLSRRAAAHANRIIGVARERGLIV
jgi:hypothetical protein